MQVQTTRFGTVEVAEERVLTFPSGLLGFASYRRFVLLQPDEEGVFYWLQSADTPELAFVVTDPCLWADDYQSVIRQEQLDMMDIPGIAGAQLFVIVNKYDDTLTANFQEATCGQSLQSAGHAARAGGSKMDHSSRDRPTGRRSAGGFGLIVLVA